MSFPSADLVEIAAGQFPPARRTAAVVSKSPVFFGGHNSDWNTDREGPAALVTVAPGMVKLSRFDPARRERALRSVAAGDYSQRGVVTEWTAKSQSRMMQTIRQLDLHGYVVGRVPVMVTLTLPGDWIAVAPDAAEASAIFQRFVKRWTKKWGRPVWLWKREFQDRGAPHWHLWLVPPLMAPVPGIDPLTEAEQDAYFRAWVSRSWTASVRPDRTPDTGIHLEAGCACSEWCRSLLAGTGVDRAAGMNARDPQRLAVYFLKESRGGSGKAYQNSIPWLWCVGGLAPGQLGPFPERKIPRGSVGRFWGSAGLAKAVHSVQIDEQVAVKLWRAMSAARAKQLRINAVRDEVNERTGEVVTVAGSKPMTRVVRSYPDWRELDAVAEEEVVTDVGLKRVWLVSHLDYTGVQAFRRRRRPVARVVKSTQQAGWIGANDGPALAAQLAHYANQIAGDRSTKRDILHLIPALAHLAPVPSTARAAYLERKRVEGLDLVELAAWV